MPCDCKDILASLLIRHTYQNCEQFQSAIKWLNAFDDLKHQEKPT